MGVHRKNSYYMNEHSCYLLQYHLVLVTKYRHPVITGCLKEDLITYIKKYFKESKIKLIEINTDLDHIHILFDGKPNMNISVFVNALKTNSSRYIRKNHDVSKYYWKNIFWSNSYFICSVNDKNEKVVSEYIKNQNKGNSSND